MKRIIFTVCAIFVTMPALADQPSYTFLQGGYQEIDLDVGGGFDVDGDGFALGGSLDFADHWFGFASYSSIGFPASVDLNQIQVGVGWHTPVSDNTSFFATVGYVEAEIDAPGGNSIDDSGYSLGVGIRSNVSELIELYGTISHVDYGDGDSTAFGGGIYFNITEEFALGLGASTDDDVTGYGANFRWHFGN